MLLANEDFRGCVSRCYYAAYQAMWAAVGEPEKKPRWEHSALSRLLFVVIGLTLKLR
jgi:uncharacterized protein (UPF0332 family)